MSIPYNEKNIFNINRSPIFVNFLLVFENMSEIKTISIDTIIMNPFQPRKVFMPEELEELKESILMVGLIHPPTVRPIEEGQYELLSGERRLRASQLAGLTQIPVYVKHCSLKDSAHAALIENIQRVDLNPLEIASALKRLIEEFNYSQEELSRKVGKKRSTVANYLRLLALPPAIQCSLRDDRISMGHAKAILSLEEIDKQMILHDWILRHSFSVREAEDAAKNLTMKEKIENEAKPENIFILSLERRLEERLGTKVNISSQGEKGVVQINYYNLDDLDRLLEVIGA
jgi:ParB family chromosome partitioning protein